MRIMHKVDELDEDHLEPEQSPDVAVADFFDLDLAWTLACLFFSSDRANFRPHESQVNGFSPRKFILNFS